MKAKIRKLVDEFVVKLEALSTGSPKRNGSAKRPRGLAALSPEERSEAGRKAAATRKRRAAGRKAAETRRANAA
jgi:hypothetical protein